MFIFESAFLYIASAFTPSEYVDFVTDISVDWNVAGAPIATLKQEFAGVESPPRTLKVSFSRLMAHQPNPLDKRTARLSLDLDIPIGLPGTDPPIPVTVHKFFVNRTKVRMGIYLGDGSVLVSDGLIVAGRMNQSVGTHLNWSYDFCGDVREWQPGQANIEF